MQEKIYSGKESKLLIVFHLGATCARACYSILHPGSGIHIEQVQRFRASGGSTVPCVVYYDSEGNGLGIGKDECCVAGKEKIFGVPIFCAPPLSFGKHSEDVFSDFLTCLNDEVQAHIRDSHPYTSSAVLDPTTAHYTIIGPSHMSETLLRSVAKKIGIIKDEQHDTNMTFLTEEEANFEAYLNDDCNVLAGEEGDICIVNIDYDLLTFNSFSYKMVPRQVEAIAESQFNLKGYSAVNEEARGRLTAMFIGSESEHLIPTMLEFFNHTIRPAFCKGDLSKAICCDPVQFQKYKTLKTVKAVKSLKKRKLWLEGTTVALFFEPLVRSIIEGVLNQIKVAQKPIYDIFLVGVGASSDYIFQDTKKRLGTELPNIRVSKSLDQPEPGPLLTGGVAKAIRSLHEIIANVSEKTTEALAPAEPVPATSTDVPDKSRPECSDEAMRALKILENIVNTQRNGEKEILALREENETLKSEAKLREQEYLELQEKNIHLSNEVKELEEWREKVMAMVGVIQEKTHEIIKVECPMPTVAEGTGSSNEYEQQLGEGY